MSITKGISLKMCNPHCTDYWYLRPGLTAAIKRVYIGRQWSSVKPGGRAVIGPAIHCWKKIVGKIICTDFTPIFLLYLSIVFSKLDVYGVIMDKGLLKCQCRFVVPHTQRGKRTRVTCSDDCVPSAGCRRPAAVACHLHLILLLSVECRFVRLIKFNSKLFIHHYILQ